MKLNKILKKYENPGMHNQLGVIWKKAKGAFIYDNRNK